MKTRYNFDLRPKTKSFPHQIEAIEFIKGKVFVPLFDEQGLGKTKIVIDSLCDDIRDKTVDGALIICRKYLIPTWEEEIQKHSYLKSITLIGAKSEKGKKFMAFSHFYILNYESLVSEVDRVVMFLKIRNLAIVLDESQKIKNPKSKTTRAVFNIKDLAKKRIIISGTPVANKPEDIWAQFYFLDNGNLLGKDFNTFKKKYTINLAGDEKLSKKTSKLEDLRNTINMVSIRRLKNQVLELPEKRYQDIIVELKGQQKAIYDKLKDELYIEMKTLNGKQIIDESENILKKLLRLCQIASNPALVSESYTEIPSKFSALDTLVHEIIERNEKVIIWTSFTNNIRTLRRRYKDLNPLMLFGEILIEKRRDIVKKFSDNSIFKILIANPAAAREGLTLTSSNNAIYLDRNFNLIDYLQSQDRIHRISQTKICNIHKLIAKNTIDEYIDELLYKKQKIAQFLQGDIDRITDEKNYLTKEDLFRILGVKGGTTP